MKHVLTRIGFQYIGLIEIPNARPSPIIMKTAINERLKWNCPTLTWSETSSVKLSENPKIEIPDTSIIAPRVVGVNVSNKAT